MIIQLAYYKMYGKSRPTYESAATRRFQLGRTETCRTVSDESVAWCSAMADAALGDATRVDRFRKAINAHLEYITAASDGKGVDRHLFGLKKLLEPGEDVPAIYKDPPTATRAPGICLLRSSAPSSSTATAGARLLTAGLASPT